MNGGDLLTKELKKNGVDFVSTVSGNGILAFYSACKRAGIKLIDYRNEQAAAYSADAYARLTGRIGVVAVSSGIAHCNALTGIANAYFDGAPVMLITGATPGYGNEKGPFQEFDQVGLADPICKYSTVVNRVDDLAFKVRKAFAEATKGRRGPVHITIPEDLYSEKIEDVSTTSEPINYEQSLGGADPKQIRRIVELLKESKNPLLIAGTNLFYANSSSSMIRFCESASIPIVIPIWDRAAINKPHPNFVGFVGPASGQPRLLPDADLIFLAGANVDYRLGYLMPPAINKNASIVRVDIDYQLYSGIEPNVEIIANPTTVFNQLTEDIKGNTAFLHKDWLNEAQKRWLNFRHSMTGPKAKEGSMTGKNIVDTIYKQLTEDTVFLIDGGNIGQWAHMLTDKYPSNWLTCGSSAVVGWGLPGAMGAKLAYPDRHVLLLSGDGAFGFTLGELEAAARQKLGFVVVVAVDEAWGIVVTTQKQLFGEEGIIASRFSSQARYDKVAVALGANGVRVETPDELGTAILQGFKDDKRPTVIQVPIQVGGPADVKY